MDRRSSLTSLDWWSFRWINKCTKKPVLGLRERFFFHCLKLWWSPQVPRLHRWLWHWQFPITVFIEHTIKAVRDPFDIWQNCCTVWKQRISNHFAVMTPLWCKARTKFAPNKRSLCPFFPSLILCPFFMAFTRTKTVVRHQLKKSVQVLAVQYFKSQGAELTST